MGVCICSVFCCTLLYVHSSIAIIFMGKRELVALLNLSSWCLVMVERLFLAVLWGCLRFVIVVFPDHTHLLFLIWENYAKLVKTDEKLIIFKFLHKILPTVEYYPKIGICFAIFQDVQTVGFNIYLKPVQFIMLYVPPSF